MTARVAIVGLGLVGGRLARDLASGHPEVGLALHSGRPERREELRRVFADAIGAGTVSIHGTDQAVASEVATVVLTGDQRLQVELAGVHLAAGHHVVTTVDSFERASELSELDDLARRNDVTLVIGACFSPGLSDIITAYGATRFDSVQEVHFARHGAGGQQCAADRDGAVRRTAHVLHDAQWATRRGGSGRELCWFPDPLGGRDAYFADTAEPLLAARQLGDLQRCTARIVLSARDRLAQHLANILPTAPEGGIGAVRVELRGTRGAERMTLVLGALDRPGVASGVVASAVVMAVLRGEAPTGAQGAGAVADPMVMLRRLREKGVRVAELCG